MDVPSRLNAALAGRYEIQREIGRGGMATVYLANDVRHQRHVALKVLDPGLAASLGTERFLAEIRVTARLQHPNVLPLFDSGEADGLLFYVMPFVVGESLRVLLDREGPLPVADATRLAGAIASALDHAHRNGVVHRDIKPENVLLSDGVPMVADFGIAKAVSLSRLDTQTGAGLTQVGTSLGTPSYMSPEQAMGEEVDGRTDVYALGCMLYEMLAGDVPFTGTSAQSVIAKHITMAVPSIRDLRDSVPLGVEATIMRAMAKEPADRFTNPAQFAAALVSAPAVEPMPDYSCVVEPVTRSTSPLAGRRKELAEVMEKLDGLADGRGAFILLGGEPGVGKTKLAEAVLLEARRRGWFCVVGHCYEMEGAPPYLPFLEQMEYVSRVVPPGRFRAVLGNGAGELARIMPAIRHLYADIPEPLDLPPDQQRHYLFSRFREYMERSSRNVPSVLLFDDLHWADESTLLLLEHLAPHVAQQRVLVLGTYRDVELDVARPFARTLERLTRQRHAERIVLRRMPQDDVAALLATLGAPDPPDALVAAIFRETEGNPFFIEEVFRHLREEGLLLDAEGRWLSDLHLDQLEVPEGVRLVIGRRLERVSADCRAMLVAAAVVGPRFTLAVLEALGELDSDALLDALEQAEKAGLILSHIAGRQTHYTFAHELIRQTLLSSLSMPRRQRRHQRTADAIEKAYAGKLDAHTADLAYHLFQAGAAIDTERTTGVLLLAAQQALAAGAFDEALAQVEKAVSILETQGDRRHADLLFVRGEALRGLGHWGAAIQAFEQALALFESLERTNDVVDVIIAMGDVLLWTISDHARSTELFHRALSLIPPTPSATRVALLVRAAYSTSLTADYAAGMALIGQALELAGALGDEVLVAEALGARGVIHMLFACSRDAIADLTEALPVMTRAGKRWDAIRVRATLLRQLSIVGRMDEALAMLPEVMREAMEIGHLGAWFNADISRGTANWARSGNVAELEEFARHALAAWAPLGPWSATANLFLAMAMLEAEQGDDPAACIAESGMTHGNEAWADIAWADYFLHSAQTHPARALGVLEQYAHRLPVGGGAPTGGAQGAMLRVIRGLAILGEVDRAAAFYPQSIELLARGGRVDIDLVAECECGIAAAAGRQWDLAEQHFVNALHTALTAPHVPAQGDVRRWHAWMLLARRGPGDVERAQGMLRDAIALFERIGLPRRARICKGLLAETMSPTDDVS